VLRGLHVMSAHLHDALATNGGERWLYRRHGLIQAYEGPRPLAAAVQALDAARELGVEAQVLSEAETRAVYPEASGRVVGALSFAEDAHMDPALFTRAIALQAVDRGATVQTGCEVIALEEDGARVRLLTTRGSINADQVVLAAGAWTGPLLSTLGVRLPLEPGKGYSMDVPRPLGFPEVPLFLGEARVVLTPIGNRLRMGSTLELSGWDTQIRRQRLGRIRAVAESFLGPRVIGAPVQVWRGLRPLTPDGLPLIGRLRSHRRAIIASGHCLIGLSLAPVTGQLVAEIAGGADPSLDLTPLRPERF
jgi:D-amino-acid dehydrogenase